MTLFPLSVLSISGSLSDMTCFKKHLDWKLFGNILWPGQETQLINCVQFKHSQIIFLFFYNDKQVKWSWKLRQNYNSNIQYIFKLQN